MIASRMTLPALACLLFASFSLLAAEVVYGDHLLNDNVNGQVNGVDYADEGNPYIITEASDDDPLYFPDADYHAPIEGDLELGVGERFGYDGGFFIKNSNDTFSLFFNGMTQIRYYYSTQSEMQDRYKFEIRRTDFYFTGHFIDESWRYVLGLEAGAGGTPELDDVYIAKSFNDNVWVQVGQFSTPFLRESLISSTRQPTIERSLITKYFATNLSTGVMLGLENEHAKWLISASNGYFQHDTAAGDLDDHEFDGKSYALISRFEFKPFGDWQQFRGFSAPGGTERGLMIGLATGYQRDKDEADIEELGGTIDVTLQGNGWNIFGMFVAQQDLINQDKPAYGAQVNGGYFIDPDKDLLELFAQYQWGDSNQRDSVTWEVEPNLSVLSTGIHVYLNPQHLKWSTDIGYAFNGVARTWAVEGDGWRQDGTSGQVVGRTQLQLVI